MKKEITKNEYILITVLIFLSVTPLVDMSIKAFGVLIITIIFGLKKMNTGFGNVVKFLPLLFLSLVIIILDFLNANKISDIKLFSMYVPLVLLMSMILRNYISKKTFFITFDRIMVVVALLSLISVILYTYFPSVILMMPGYTNKHTNHKTLIIFNNLISEGGPLKRNSGIAWEPGVFQLLLNISLYIRIVLSTNDSKLSKRNISIIILYIFTIITTKSTIGLILLLLNIIFMLYKLTNYKNRLIYLTVIVIMIILSTPLMVPIIQQNIFNKGVGSFSFNIRFDPFYEGLKVPFKYPLGLGNTRFDLYYDDIRAPWDSIGQMLVRYGVFFLIFYIFRLFLNNKEDPILFIIIFATLFTQNLWFTPLIMFFLFVESQKTKILRGRN